MILCLFIKRPWCSGSSLRLSLCLSLTHRPTAATRQRVVSAISNTTHPLYLSLAIFTRKHGEHLRTPSERFFGLKYSRLNFAQTRRLTKPKEKRTTPHGRTCQRWMAATQAKVWSLHATFVLRAKFSPQAPADVDSCLARISACSRSVELHCSGCAPCWRRHSLMA